MNSHNLAVLLNDGMDRFVDGKKQKVRGLTVEVIDDMIDSLTDTQKKIARQVSTQIMDGINKEAINEVSTRLEFFEIAKVENYWPARRSIIRTVKGKVMSGILSTVEGMGLLKERVGIGNPMRLSGFFETVHNANKNVSKYVGMAEPLREAKAVLSTDVLAEMEDSGRAVEKDRLIEFIVRIEGQLVPEFEGDLDRVVRKTIGGFAKSKLFLRPKIAIRQQLSQLLISAYVDPKYMAEMRKFMTPEQRQSMRELSPQIRARNEGFQFDRDIGDAFAQNELMNYLTGDISYIDKTGIGLRYFDTKAIEKIYQMAEAEVTDKNPDIDMSSDEGKALLKDRFEWLVRHTQPMWHIKDRSLLGSDPRPLVRLFTMFMSQREQMVRMTTNGIADFAYSEKTTEDATRLGRSLGAVALNMALFTLYNFAWAVLVHRKRKEVKDLFKSAMKDIFSLPFFGKYLSASAEIVFNIFADEPNWRKVFDENAFESILADILLEAIPNFARAGKHFVTKERYQSGQNRGEEKWKNELLVATDALAEAFASVRGLPYYGAKELVDIAESQITGGEQKKETKTIRRRKP